MGSRRDTADSLEIERICALSVTELPDAAATEAVSREVVQGSEFEAGFRLHPCQAGALLAFDLYDGLFAPIGVGWGKTYISLLVADRAFCRNECQRALLMVPPNVLPQLVGTNVPAARRIFGLRVPVISLAGRDARGRAAAAQSGKRGLYVMPYTYLSTRDAEEVLHAIGPDLVVLDEAHRVKNRRAARTGRLMRYLEAAGRRVRVCALSGTITSKTIRDYHHLISHALKERSPLPQSEVLMEGWSTVLDAGADEAPSATGPIAPLLDWARREFPAEEIPEGLPGFRAAYRLRLNSAPGVVASGDAELGTSLVLRNVPVPDPEARPGHGELRRLQKQVAELWISPSGDEIEEGMHKWRHLYELASGFFYRLRWPTEEEVARRRAVPAATAAAFLAQALVHHEARQSYHAGLRRWLERRARPALDTPLLVGRSMALHGADEVGEDLHDLWRKMKDLEFDGMPERVSEPVRVCDAKVRHAAALAMAERELARSEGARCGVLVWYWHDEVGRWLVDVLEKEGARPVWCPADSVRPGSSARILSAEVHGQVVVASIGGHGEGKNLQGEGQYQGFERQVVAEFPRRAGVLEQLLGRTHRVGQAAEELVPLTINTDEFDHQNMAACLIDALYVHQTTGTRQKAIYCGYDPLPRVYPIDFLRERGFTDLARLDERARKALEDKFGPARA